MTIYTTFPNIKTFNTQFMTNTGFMIHIVTNIPYYSRFRLKGITRVILELVSSTTSNRGRGLLGRTKERKRSTKGGK